MPIIRKWFRKTKELRYQIKTLYIALRDPRTPWYAKALAFIILGYALSPIDLIPDFIPFLGHLDELIIIPIGIYLIKKLIPSQVWEEASLKVTSYNLPSKLKKAVIIIIITWLIVLFLVVYFVIKY